MGFFTPANEKGADDIASRYPRRRSAMIPLLHLAQEQEGWVTGPAICLLYTSPSPRDRG